MLSYGSMYAVTDATEGPEAPMGVQEAKCRTDGRGGWCLGPRATGAPMLAATAAGVAQPGLSQRGSGRPELRLSRRGSPDSPARLRHRLGPGSGITLEIVIRIHDFLLARSNKRPSDWFSL